MTLNTQSLKSLDEVRVFLAGSSAVSFESPTGEGRYLWLTVTLRQFHYGRLTRADKGVLRAFLGKVTGYSRAQLCRLIAQWQKGRKIVDRRGPPTKPFTQRYTATDVVLLAKLDRLHGQLSGPATKKLAERACNVFGDAAFKTLAGISVAHLYNLRASACYQRQRGHHEPTRSRSVAIGERRRPQPNGEPGYLRVDSVHQGDWDGIKGLYVINLVDAVLQYEVVIAVERISEFFLIPAHAHLAAAYRAGAAVFTPHPEAHALYANKHNLVLLSDPGWLHAAGLDAATIETLRAGIPLTQRVQSADAEALWRDRKHWFFKPASGFGSRGAYRGDKLTRKVFAEILAADYVAQAVVPPSERHLAPDQPLKLDLRNYVYDGAVQLVAARLYQGQTTNFRTPGRRLCAGVSPSGSRAGLMLASIGRRVS